MCSNPLPRRPRRQGPASSRNHPGRPPPPLPPWCGAGVPRRFTRHGLRFQGARKNLARVPRVTRAKSHRAGDEAYYGEHDHAAGRNRQPPPILAVRSPTNALAWKAWLATRRGAPPGVSHLRNLTAVSPEPPFESPNAASDKHYLRSGNPERQAPISIINYCAKRPSAAIPGTSRANASARRAASKDRTGLGAPPHPFAEPPEARGGYGMTGPPRAPDPASLGQVTTSARRERRERAPLQGVVPMRSQPLQARRSPSVMRSQQNSSRQAP